ncbi:MAG TPA: efflux RND transporter periplasmic adaptor subunit [Bryobacteraceae bacterium]|nr:efflux RND transporter periplasmic adaptor subunit [Bryobacteraceae bacterium]
MKVHFLILLFAAIWGVGCNRPDASSEAAAPPNQNAPKDQVVLSSQQQIDAKVEIQAAALSEAPEMLSVKGHIALDDDRTWKVGVRTIGSITKVYANLGDSVRKGQILARYHADEVRDSRAQYRATQAELDRSKAAAVQAERNLKRAQRLLELKAGSVQQVEQTQQDLVTARAAVKKAEIEVDRGRDLLEDDLKVPADPSANRTDETEDDVPILAPGDGYVIEKNVTLMKTVDLSSVTYVIGDLSRVWMLAAVRQDDLAKLRTGQSAFVTLPGQDDVRIAGRLTNLGQQFDPTTRIMQVRIELPNPQNRLRPEMLANAEFPIGKGKSVLIVPSDAVQEVNGVDVIFVRIAADKFVAHPVQVGRAVNGSVPVLEGIQAGDPLVVHGSFILKSQLLRSTLENE